ncbi:MAG: Spy/CpxP family protein refolding chaperone [Myxococcota bacterium]
MANYIALAVAGLLLAACGSKDKSGPAKVTEEERARSKARKASGRNEGKAQHFQKKRQAQQLSNLCEDLECTDAQRGALEKLIAESRKAAPAGGRRSSANSDANEALAEAFTQDDFSAAALGTYHEAVEASSGGLAERNKAIVPGLVALHKTLSPEQRATLADLTVTDGLRWLTTSRARRGAAGGPARTPDPQRRAERITKRICKEVLCEGDQESTIVGLLVGFEPGRADVPQADRDALAGALRGEALTEAQVSEFLTAEATQNAATTKSNDAVWIALHAALRGDQRGDMAELVRQRGTRALGGARVRRMGPNVRGR